MGTTYIVFSVDYEHQPLLGLVLHSSGQFLFLYIYFCYASAWAQDLANAKQAFYLWTTPKPFPYNLKMILFILWEFLICTQYVLLKSTLYSLLQLISHPSHWTNIIIKITILWVIYMQKWILYKIFLKRNRTKWNKDAYIVQSIINFDKSLFSLCLLNLIHN